MAGGRIKPDGRPAQAPGVGANSRRHDLEAPSGSVPPLHGDTGLQQGDIQELKAGQRIAPLGKQNQAPAKNSRTTPRAPTKRGQRASGGVDIPDPIEMAGNRMGGSVGQASGDPSFHDPAGWVPFLRQLATDPSTSGALSTTLVRQIGNVVRRPNASTVRVMDMNAADDALGEMLDG